MDMANALLDSEWKRTANRFEAMLNHCCNNIVTMCQAIIKDKIEPRAAVGNLLIIAATYHDFTCKDKDCEFTTTITPAIAQYMNVSPQVARVILRSRQSDVKVKLEKLGL